MFDATEIAQKRTAGASKKVSSKNMNLLATNATALLTAVNLGNDSASSSVAKKAAILVGNQKVATEAFIY